MIKFFKIILEVIVDAALAVKSFIANNIRTFANIIMFLLPFGMLYIGQYVALDRGMIMIGGEVLVPFMVGIVAHFLRSFANKIGKGVKIPMPNKRFTEVDDDGEVNVNNDRLQEMILYMADLEDWLERKGMRQKTR